MRNHMSKRLPYSSVITEAAVAIARKTFQQRGVRLVNKRGLQCIGRTTMRGDALPIVANQIGRWS